MLGGVAGHAGLFSDAHDLALLMEVMRHGRQCETAFSSSAPATRGGLYLPRLSPLRTTDAGLGWDKPGLEEDTGASGNAGSWSSFGHSGFTGTLAWTDPAAGWTVQSFWATASVLMPPTALYIDEDIRTKALEIVEDAVHSPEQIHSTPGPRVGPR